MRRSIPLLAVAVAYALLLVHGGCGPSAPPATDTKASGSRFIQSFSANIERTLESPGAPLNAARNETASTVIQLANLPKPNNQSALTLRLAPLELQSENARIDVGQVRAYQVLAMPVDANRAGFVRHTGQQASSRTMPRALLPVPMDGGKINVTALRDPSEPLKPNSRIGLSDEPALLWFDVQIPPTAKAGRYNSNIELLKDGQVIDSTPLSVNVYDFVLPDERHLHMVGRVEWDSLEALYPDLFETTTPEYMSRSTPKYAAAIKLLDQLVALAHEHRTTVVVPRLQPIVKWPANQPPQVDWTEFDTIVEPWLSGSGFADHIPVGYWPLPRIDFLDRYPAALQFQYWSAAASHFAQRDWMDRAWVEVEKETKGRANAQESVKLSEQAAAILAAHPQLRVSLPLEDAQLQFRNPNNANLIDKASLDRLMTAASGLVMAAPAGPPSPAMMKLKRWLRTDLPGLVPYIGAGGDERDVRLWAWLAFLRQTQVIGWDGALPHTKSPQEAADPNDLTWFYPGRWFGVDAPVPTIQLKWLRRAQQDFEYLYLAQQRGELNYAWVMARLMAKPVQTPRNEQPDPTHGLLSGTTDQALWTQALELLAKTILVREPGKERDEVRQQEINRDTFVWLEPQERPLLIARNATWGWAAKPGNWVDLQLGVDTYNASDNGGLDGHFQWVSAPRGWEFNPQPVAITPNDAIQMYKVKQFALEARVNLDHLTPETRQPIELKFTESKRNKEFNLRVAAPVAVSDKREGPLAIDGSLADWDDAADGIHHGPLVVMLDRPSLQKQAMRMASTNSSVYSNWAAKSFYVAFKLDGLSGGNAGPAGARVERNFVDYQLRRAWGEDLCEILIQPVYVKPGDVGQIVHLVCKPTGALTVSTKHSPRNQRLLGSNFNEVVGAKLEFANATSGSLWRGELKIPWELINDKDHVGQRPTLMRFNFVQHKHATGESSSWAGPIDYGRDDSFMGLLFLRDARSPGMGQSPRE